MTGGTFIGLILLSMAWLFFVLGALLNLDALRRSRRARPGEHVPWAIPILPGAVGSVAVFFTLPLLAGRGLELIFPWLWILLPLVLDIGCVPGLVATWARRKSL